MFSFERDRERERDRVWAGERQKERETQNPKQAPGSELFSTEPHAGLEPTNREIMTWAEVGCLTIWATQVPLRDAHLIVKLHRRSGVDHTKLRVLLPSGSKGESYNSEGNAGHFWNAVSWPGWWNLGIYLLYNYSHYCISVLYSFLYMCYVS